VLMPEDHPRDHRVDALAVDVNNLKAQVSEVVTTVKLLASSTSTIQGEVREVNRSVNSLQGMLQDDRDAFRSELKSINQLQLSASRTNWPVLISFAGVSLTVIALVGGILAFALRQPVEVTNGYQQKEIDRLQDQVETLRNNNTLRAKP
jgi:hypothetical protein